MDRIRYCGKCGQATAWKKKLCEHCHCAESGPLHGTVEDWRAHMLDRLAELVVQGVKRVEWRTAKDDHVCGRCQMRNRGVYTPKELRAELVGTFCKPAKVDERCRCTLLPVLDE